MLTAHRNVDCIGAILPSTIHHNVSLIIHFLIIFSFPISGIRSKRDHCRLDSEENMLFEDILMERSVVSVHDSFSFSFILLSFSQLANFAKPFVLPRQLLLKAKLELTVPDGQQNMVSIITQSL